jgi:hypothetical protein
MESYNPLTEVIGGNGFTGGTEETENERRGIGVEA